MTLQKGIWRQSVAPEWKWPSKGACSTKNHRAYLGSCTSKKKMECLKNWDACCLVAIEQERALGIKAEKCSHTIRNRYQEFRKERNIKVKIIQGSIICLLFCSKIKHHSPNQTILMWALTWTFCRVAVWIYSLYHAANDDKGVHWCCSNWCPIHKWC